MISTQEIIKNNISKTEFEDFCGEHTIDFNQMDSAKSETFLMAIEKNLKFSEIAAQFKDDLDQLAYSAVYAFSIGKISRAAAASFLEYRSMKMHFPEVVITDIPQDISINSLAILLPVEGRTERINLQKAITAMPSYESCAFTIKIPDEDLQNPRIAGFLDLAKDLGVINLINNKNIAHAEDAQKTEGETHPPVSDDLATYVVIGSLPVRDAMTTSIYYDHAKKTYPRLGEYSIDMINDSIKKFGRYLSVDFPGIATTGFFHKIKAPPFYINLHDEVHRRLTSTIPNPVYTAFLSAIEMVREKTGIKWSREIWDATDMEVGVFLGFYATLMCYEKINIQNIEKNTHDFTLLLNATVYTEGRTAGLFTSTPYNDTLWLLLIDMVLDQKKWLTMGIDFATLDHISPYRKMYDFVIENKNKIENVKNPAEQAAIIKSTWFGISLKYQNEIKFEVVSEPNKPRRLQIMADNQPIVNNKSDAFKTIKEIKKIFIDFKYGKEFNREKLVDYIATHVPMDIVCFDPVLFREFHDAFGHICLVLYELIKYKANIIDAHVRYNIHSFKDLNDLRIIDYRNDVISLVFKDEKKVSGLRWTDASEIYIFCNANPEFADLVKKIFFTSHPYLADLFSLADTNYLIKRGTSITCEIMNAVEYLYKKKLTPIDNNIFDTVIKLNQKKCLRTFLGAVEELLRGHFMDPDIFNLLLSKPEHALKLSSLVIKLKFLTLNLNDKKTSPVYAFFKSEDTTTPDINDQIFVIEKFKKLIHGDKDVSFTEADLKLCEEDTEFKSILDLLALCNIELPIEKSRLEL